MTVTLGIKEFDGTLIHSQVRWLAGLSELSREQFSWATSIVDLLLMPANEPMQAEPSPPSEMEALRGLGFLKRRRIA